MCFHLHYAMLCLANVNINTLHAYFYGIGKVSFFQRKQVLYLLSHIFTNGPNPTALSDVFGLFTTIVYLVIQVACFDAIVDCITNMIGRLFYLHIFKSTSNNQACKRQGFLVFILTFTSHFTFSLVFIL